MVLVEFESPNCGFVQKTSNDLISNVRKGLTQISDWKIWMDNNRNDFIRNNFGKINSEIPTSRIYYCLVVSRRELMDEKAQSIRSQKMYESKNLKIITYDRLADYITELRYGY